MKKEEESNALLGNKEGKASVCRGTYKEGEGTKILCK